MEEVYIVNAYRSAVSKAKKGKLRFTRPDDLGAEIICQITKKIPGFDNNFINDVIVGNATLSKSTLRLLIRLNIPKNKH